MVEKIRASLGHDEELLTAYKDTSGKYRHGSIDAGSYVDYVKGYGLSHLVLDMARLCPDAKRQKELIDTHNACLTQWRMVAFAEQFPSKRKYWLKEK